jgi:chromosome segregation ATPase
MEQKKEALEERTGQGSRAASSETVQTLSLMIKDLEDQLERMLAINDAIEKDLSKEQQRRMELERTIDSLEREIAAKEHEVAQLDDLKTEVSHLTGERSRLAVTIEELGKQLTATEQDNRKLARQTEQLRVEREDVVEELESVEAQFSRAMELVTDLRARLAVSTEERDASRDRLQLADEKVAQLATERDSLLAEVDDSKQALEEIRRSLVDACVTTK